MYWGYNELQGHKGSCLMLQFSKPNAQQCGHRSGFNHNETNFPLSWIRLMKTLIIYKCSGLKSKSSNVNTFPYMFMYGWHPCSGQRRFQWLQDISAFAQLNGWGTSAPEPVSPYWAGIPEEIPKLWLSALSGPNQQFKKNYLPCSCLPQDHLLICVLRRKWWF